MNLFKMPETKEILAWEQQGMPVPPPPRYKQAVVEYFAQKYSITTLIETGTYLGDMIYGVKDIFKKIYSIELSEYLYLKAKERFRGINHIQLIYGDSGKKLPIILNSISEPCLFWLDGHASGGITAQGEKVTPIMEELLAIFDHPLLDRHIILIDDARGFNGTNDYPSIEYLQSLIKNTNSQLVFENQYDIMRIYK